jgi:hypothetical protein
MLNWLELYLVMRRKNKAKGPEVVRFLGPIFLHVRFVARRLQFSLTLMPLQTHIFSSRLEPDWTKVSWCE